MDNASAGSCAVKSESAERFIIKNKAGRKERKGVVSGYKPRCSSTWVQGPDQDRGEDEEAGQLGCYLEFRLRENQTSMSLS